MRIQILILGFKGLNKRTHNILFLSSDQLQAGAAQFEQSAARLKRKMRWQNLKVCHLPVSQAPLLCLILKASFY